MKLPVAVNFDCAEFSHIFGAQNFHPFIILDTIRKNFTCTCLYLRVQKEKIILNTMCFNYL